MRRPLPELTRGGPWLGVRMAWRCWWCLLAWLSWPAAALPPPVASWRPAVDSPPPRWDAPAPIGRRERRQLTLALNRSWSRCRPPSRPRRSCCRARLTQRWSGWPLRGVRVGEARHPGPDSMEVDGGRDRERSPARGQRPLRVFCPVEGCPCSDASSARGWASHSAMRPHLDDHAAGTLHGGVPEPYCTAHNLERCSVCGLLVATRYNGSHPRCRPLARQPAASGGPASPPASGGLGLDLAPLFQSNIPVLRHVPKAARGLWAQCLARALAAVAHHNSMAAWQDLLMLPKAVLRPAPRGGPSAGASCAVHRQAMQPMA